MIFLADLSIFDDFDNAKISWKLAFSPLSMLSLENFLSSLETKIILKNIKWSLFKNHPISTLQSKLDGMTLSYYFSLQSLQAIHWTAVYLSSASFCTRTYPRAKFFL